MNSFEEMLNESVNGLLEEEVTENENQPLTENNQQLLEDGEQIPQQGAPQQGDPNTQGDPNDQPVPDNGMTPDTDPNGNIQTPQFDNIETVSRLNALRALSKIHTICEKLNTIPKYKHNKDIIGIIDLIDNINDKLDLFSTHDLIEFNEMITKTLYDSVMALKKTIKNDDDVKKLKENQQFYPLSESEIGAFLTESTTIEAIIDDFLKTEELSSDVLGTPASIILRLKDNLLIANELRNKVGRSEDVYFSIFGMNYAKNEVMHVITEYLETIAEVIERYKSTFKRYDEDNSYRKYDRFKNISVISDKFARNPISNLCPFKHVGKDTILINFYEFLRDIRTIIAHRLDLMKSDKEKLETIFKFYISITAVEINSLCKDDLKNMKPKEQADMYSRVIHISMKVALNIIKELLNKIFNLGVSFTEDDVRKYLENRFPPYDEEDYAKFFYTDKLKDKGITLNDLQSQVTSVLMFIHSSTSCGVEGLYSNRFARDIFDECLKNVLEEEKVESNKRIISLGQLYSRNSAPYKYFTLTITLSVLSTIMI